jgi:hypothetical protein
VLFLVLGILLTLWRCGRRLVLKLLLKGQLLVLKLGNCRPFNSKRRLLGLLLILLTAGCRGVLLPLWRCGRRLVLKLLLKRWLLVLKLWRLTRGCRGALTLLLKVLQNRWMQLLLLLELLLELMLWLLLELILVVDYSLHVGRLRG